MSRILYAAGRNRVTAVAMTGGWLLVIVADLVIVPFVPHGWVVPALGLGTTIGLTAAGLALIVAVRRTLGRAALRGLPRAGLAGLGGGLAGAAAGVGVAVGLPVHGFAPNAAVTVLAAAAATVAFLAVTFLTDGGDLRAVTNRLLRRAGRGRPPAAGGPAAGGEAS